MDAGPHYQKLYARVTHIWGNCKGQPNRSEIRGHLLERTASLIKVPPASGKFFFCFEAGIQGRVQCKSPILQHRTLPYGHSTDRHQTMHYKLTCLRMGAQARQNRWGNGPCHPLQEHTTGRRYTRQDGMAGQVESCERH